MKKWGIINKRGGSMKHQEKIDILKEIVLEAGKIIMDVYTLPDFGIDFKEDESPVTIADKKANDYIVGMLNKHFPEIMVLSEESADDLNRLEKRFIWLVDPLDGTKEFINRNGEFSVNIALIDNKNPIIGVIYIPIVSELYYAVIGEGAYMIDALGREKKIHVSEKLTDLRALRSRSRVSDKLLDAYDDQRVSVVSQVGSSLKGCLIARGDAEVYFSFGYTMEWDTAAMELIVKEAGGVFCELDGSQMVYNRVNTRNENGFYVLNNRENKLV
jgi:3'(2'), 5'-bisphosphate nucleotidase